MNKSYKQLKEKINTLKETDAKQVAAIIVQQLGGAGKLKAMLGAYNFTYGNNSKNEPQLVFFFKAKATNRSNVLKVTLNGRDTYTVEFSRIQGTNYKIIETFEDIYADQLKDLFESETGLYLSL